MAHLGDLTDRRRAQDERVTSVPILGRDVRESALSVFKTWPARMGPPPQEASAQQ